MTYNQDEISQAEKRSVMRQDADVKNRQQGGTFFSHALADAQIDHGRFAAINKTTVVGTEAARYPAASSAHQTELPPEPPFNVANDIVERND